MAGSTGKVIRIEVQGPHGNRIHTFDSGTVSVGRHSDNNLILDDVSVPEHWGWVVFLGSVPGAFVLPTVMTGSHGRAIPLEVRPGEPLAVGVFSLKLSLETPGKVNVPTPTADARVHRVANLLAGKGRLDPQPVTLVRHWQQGAFQCWEFSTGHTAPLLQSSVFVASAQGAGGRCAG